MPLSDKTVEVTTSSESQEILFKMQEIFTKSGPSSHQGLCIAAEFLTWVLMVVHDTEADALALFGQMAPAITQAIRESWPAIEARRQVLAELEKGEAKWLM